MGARGWALVGAFAIQVIGNGCGGGRDRDTGSLDAGSFDAGTFDAGTLDAGTLDAGADDAGTPDSGGAHDAETGAADATAPDSGGHGFAAPPCCEADGSCPSGLRCEDSFSPAPGTCVPPLGAGECWTAEDCADPATAICEGATHCSCGAPCAAPLEPGTCRDGPPTCCVTDADCGAGEICARPVSDYGECVPAPGDGECYRLSHCTSPYASRCDGAVTCACDSGCTFSPGTCHEETWSSCCASDADCAEGRCHHGACLADASTGCWSDRDCAAGEFCSGETVCPCLTHCTEADTPGTCLALPTGCCNSDADCGASEVCKGADDLVPGRCLPEPGPGGCYEPSDCGTASSGACWWCSGGSFCSCVEACPTCGLDCPSDTLGSCSYLDPCL